MDGKRVDRATVKTEPGKRFSPAMARERRIVSWVSAHRDIIEAMVDNPKLVPIVRAVCVRQIRN